MRSCLETVSLLIVEDEEEERLDKGIDPKERLADTVCKSLSACCSFASAFINAATKSLIFVVQIACVSAERSGRNASNSNLFDSQRAI
jgi:hypothetical protein